MKQIKRQRRYLVVKFPNGYLEQRWFNVFERGRAEAWVNNVKQEYGIQAEIIPVMESRDCSHPKSSLHSWLPAEWCEQCGAIRHMVAGKFGKWINPK